MTTKRRALQLQRFFVSASLGPPDNTVSFVLWRVVHRYQRAVDRVLTPLDLTHLQFTTLMLVAWLARSGEPVAQADIGRIGDIHPMQVSLVLKALENKGYVVRMPSPTNVRAKRVDLSDPGFALLRVAVPRVIDVQRRSFGDDLGVGGPLFAILSRTEVAQRALDASQLG